MNAQVQENEMFHRFELPLASGLLAAAYYRVERDRLVLFHTEVPPECSGRGVGSALARGTFDLLRASGRKAILRCPFMTRFLAVNLDYADVIAG